MRPKKFNFITVGQILNEERNARPTASFNVQTSFLTFLGPGKDFAGKFVKLYLDPGAKTIAWTFLDRELREDIEGYTQIKTTKLGVQLYVPKKLVQALKIDPAMRYVGMEVGTYKDTSPLGSDKPYYYVTLSGEPKIVRKTSAQTEQ